MNYNILNEHGIKMTQEQLVDTSVSHKINQKELLLPECIIPKVDSFINLVVALRQYVNPKFKGAYVEKFKSTYKVNCGLYYTNFHSQQSQVQGWSYSNENRLRTLVGTPKIIDSIKHLLTNIDDVTTSNNSNRAVADVCVKKRFVKKVEGQLLVEQVWGLVRLTNKEIEIEDIYNIIDKDIDIQLLYTTTLNVVPEFVIEIEKSSKMRSVVGWLGNKYRIPSEVIKSNHIDLIEEGYLLPLPRLTKIYAEDETIYGVGDIVSYNTYATATSLDYDIEYNDEDTNNIISTQITNPKYYKREATLDRYYNPYQRITRSVRKALNDHNGMTECDYSSLHINILISMVVGDFPMNELYKELFNDTKHSLKTALDQAKLTEDEKEELRGYAGDFYTNIINEFKLSQTRDDLKSDTVALINIKQDKMRHFTSLYEALGSSSALRKMRKVLFTLKENNHKHAYKVFFKAESMLVSETAKWCGEQAIECIPIHDAVCVPIERSEEVKEKMDEVARKYNVGSTVKIDAEIEVTLLTMEKKHKKITNKKKIIINYNGVTKAEFLNFTDAWFDEIVTEEIQEDFNTLCDLKEEDLEFEFDSLYMQYFSIKTEVTVSSIRKQLVVHFHNEIESHHTYIKHMNRMVG